MGWDTDAPVEGSAPVATAGGGWDADPPFAAAVPVAAPRTKTDKQEKAPEEKSLFAQAVTHVFGDSPYSRGLVKVAEAVNPLHNLVGRGEAALNIGSKALALLPSYAGAAATPPSEFKGATGPSDIQQEILKQAVYEPRTAGGKEALKPIEQLGEALKYAGKKTGQAGEYLFDLKPGASIIGDTAIRAFEAIPELAVALAGGKGAGAAPAVAESFAARAAARAESAQIAAGNRAVNTATKEAASNSGYLFADEGPLGLLTKGGQIGRTAAEKIRSKQNELNATQKLGGEVGVPQGAALSEDTFNTLKSEAGTVYQNVKNLVGPELNITNEFRNSLQQSLNKVNESVDVNPSLRMPQRILKGFLDRVKPAESAVYERPFQAMPVKRLDTDWAVDQISQLRQKAKEDFIGRKGDAGRARLGIANQLEDLVEANIGASAGPEALASFRAARERFAKIYLLERVVEPSTGAVNLPKLAQLSKTAQYRGRLTGEFKTAADLASAYPGVARKGIGEMIPTVTPFDAMFAVGSLAAGHPLAAMSRVAPGIAAQMLVR